MTAHDSIPSKRCSKCGETKSIDDFGRRSGGRHGLKGLCRDCDRPSGLPKRAPVFAPVSEGPPAFALPGETWLPIPGHESYLISDFGRVASRSRTKDTLLRSLVNAYGYLEVSLLDGHGKKKGRRVHSLVALAFKGPRPDGLQVRHLDGDKTNNRPDNLEYGTNYENQIDIIRHGLSRNGRGRPAFTEDDVRRIRRLYSEGRSTRSIAKEFGRHPLSVWSICKGRTWKRVV